MKFLFLNTILQTMTFKLFIVLPTLCINYSHSGHFGIVCELFLLVGMCETQLVLTRCSNSKQKKSDKLFQVTDVTFVEQ